MMHFMRSPTQDRATIATLDVEVLYDAEAKVWVADCEPLGIVTEAATYEAVIQQVRELVPDMLMENNINLGNQKLYLNFQHIDESAII